MHIDLWKGLRISGQSHYHFSSSHNIVVNHMGCLMEASVIKATTTLFSVLHTSGNTSFCPLFHVKRQ